MVTTNPLLTATWRLKGVSVIFGAGALIIALLTLVIWGVNLLFSPEQLDFKDSTEAVYLQPSVQAARQSLTSHNGSPLPDAEKVGGLFVRRKALILFAGRDDERSARFHNRLPKEIRARQWSEVGTVILLMSNSTQEGMWMRGNQSVGVKDKASFRLSLLDLTVGTWVEAELGGGTYDQWHNDSNHEPTRLVADFIAKLPRR